MKTKHTLGPWRTVETGETLDGDIEIVAGVTDDVAIVYAGRTDDARLIAAAPEMLEALQRIAVCAEGQEPTAEMKIAQHILKKLGLE